MENKILDRQENIAKRQAPLYSRKSAASYPNTWIKQASEKVKISFDKIIKIFFQQLLIYFESAFIMFLITFVLVQNKCKRDWRGFVLWGWFIALFAGIWILQIMMTKVQLRNYQATLKKMSNRPSGYLGVGIQKQKLGIGVIAILVTDEDGLLIESQLMKGVTVFSRFESFPKYNGLHIESLKEKLEDEPDGQAFKMAIEKIEVQMSKKPNLAV